MINHSPRLNPEHAGLLLRRAREDAGLTIRELARCAGTSHSTLIAYEKGRKQPSVVVLNRLLGICGFTAEISMTRRIREDGGVPRGDELEQVLALAEQFPARQKKDLDFPRFERR